MTNKRAYVPEQTQAKKGEALMRHTCAACLGNILGRRGGQPSSSAQSGR